jgi:hypothetical protein
MSPAARKFFFWLLRLAACQLLLIIVIFAVWRECLAKRVQTKLAELRAAGLPTNGSELNAFYPAVPDSENAALVVTQVLASFKQMPWLKLPKGRQDPTPDQREKMNLFLETNHVALAELPQILPLEKSHYPVDFTPGDSTLLPHLPGLTKLSTLLKCQTIISVEESNENGVVNSIVLQLALAHTLDAEPLLISRLRGDNAVTGAVQVLEFALNKSEMDNTSLLLLQNGFRCFGTNEDLSGPFTSDLAMTLPHFQEKWRDAQQLFWTDNGFILPLSDAIRGYFGHITGLFDEDELFFISAMQDAISEVKHPYPNCLVIYQSMYETALDGRNRGFFMGPIRFNSLRQALPHEADSMALIRSAQTALAVERFRQANGKLPQQLDELVPQFLPAVPEDPFNGQPLHYHHLEKGYVVYSIGSDGEDNGGRERPADVKSSDKTHYDITFTVER